MISLEGIVHVVFRKSLLIASGVVGSPHAAKQRPDKFRRAISGSTSDTTGAAVPDTAPFGLLGGRDLSAVVPWARVAGHRHSNFTGTSIP